MEFMNGIKINDKESLEKAGYDLSEVCSYFGKLVEKLLSSEQPDLGPEPNSSYPLNLF